MIPEGFVQALCDYAESIGDVTPLAIEREVLFTRKIANGGKGGKELVDAELNNKKFGFQVTMTVEEKFTAFCQAIKLYNGATTPMTYGAFALLQR